MTHNTEEIDNDYEIEASKNFSFKTLVKFLIGDKEAIIEVAYSKNLWKLGLFLVFTAAFAREYDQEYLLDNFFPALFLSPLMAFIMSSLLYSLLGQKLKKAEIADPYLSFMTLFMMTSPLAWLYAIPFEMFSSPKDAVYYNFYLLILVAFWRLWLFCRAMKIILGHSVTFRIVTFTSALFFFIGTFASNIFAITHLMAGNKAFTPAQEALRLIKSSASGIALLTFLLSLLLGILFKFIRKKHEHGYYTCDYSPHRFSRPLIILPLIAISCLLPYPQSRLARNYTYSQLIEENKYSEAVNYIQQFEEKDLSEVSEFRPHNLRRHETKLLIKILRSETKLKPWYEDKLFHFIKYDLIKPWGIKHKLNNSCETKEDFDRLEQFIQKRPQLHKDFYTALKERAQDFKYLPEDLLKDTGKK